MKVNGEIAGMELVVEKALEFAAELVRSAMDLAPVEVESKLVRRHQNPENSPFGNAVEVAPPLFVD
jgi:hypothetical protein